MTLRPLISPMLALLGAASMASAATYFTEDFSDNSPGPNMAIGTPYGTATTTTTGNFTITSGDSARIYLGTVGTDYSTVNFVFQATVTVPNTTSAWAIAFIGMGNSAAGTGTDQYGEPLIGSDLFMALRNDHNRLEYRDNNTTALVTPVGYNPIAAPLGGTHLLRMTWNATTKQAFYEYDAGNNGSIDGFFAVDGANNSFTSANSQLVLGGGRGLTFDNVSVTVPEPTAALLGGIGLLALLRRRRG